jgi:hypothetical protein
MNIDELCVFIEGVINTYVHNIILKFSVGYLSTFEKKCSANYMKIYTYVLKTIFNSNDSFYKCKTININNDYEKYWRHVLLNYT